MLNLRPVISKTTNWKQVELGEANRAAVRALLSSHLGISRTEIAKRLDLSLMAVSRHVASIRAEWGGKTLPTRRGLAAEPCLSDAEKKTQASRCGCMGADDYCVCQNAPDAITRKERARNA